MRTLDLVGFTLEHQHHKSAKVSLVINNQNFSLVAHTRIFIKSNASMAVLLMALFLLHIHGYLTIKKNLWEICSTLSWLN